MRSGNRTITATLADNAFTDNTASGGNTGATSNGGAASGGAVYIRSNARDGTVKLSDNYFNGNLADGGSGRNGRPAEGGSITLDDEGRVAFDMFDTPFNGTTVQGGDSVGGTAAGNGGVARGGAIALLTGTSTGASFDLEQVTCEDTRAYGGECGDSTDVHAPLYHGGDAYGGGVYFSAGASQSPHLVVNTCQFTGDIASGGLGGSAPASGHNRNRPLTSFAGGDANGGGLAIIVGPSHSPSFSISDTTFQQCIALASIPMEGK
jgi:hypothetical protein